MRANYVSDSWHRAKYTKLQKKSNICLKELIFGLGESITNRTSHKILASCKKYLQREQVERIEETTKELEGPLIIRGDVAKIFSQWEGIGNVYVSF